MTSESKDRLLVGFALAGVLLVACLLGLMFSGIRLVAAFLELTFALMAISLLVRFHRRQHRVTQELLDKISQLAEEMKQEREAHRARSARPSQRSINPNGRNWGGAQVPDWT